MPSPWFTIEQNESSMLGCIASILIACSQPGQYGVALEQINATGRINGDGTVNPFIFAFTRFICTVLVQRTVNQTKYLVPRQ